MPAGFSALLGESPALVGLRTQLEHLVRRYATARRLPPVLLLGETGTGKSLIARTLHATGPRARGPFVDVACPAIPDTLMEAQMFGVERGAFTDARESKPGLFTVADRGTIFLDEVGLLSDTVQAKLLKVVEDQQVRPLGATTSRAVDAWVIAATSEDLEAAVQKRRFREDLYFRLAVVTIVVPPLRERGDDVILLARHLLERAREEYGLAPKTFTPEALAALRGRPWPGNIRELGNVVERVALRSEAATVTAEALELTALPSRPGPAPAARPPGPGGGGIDDALAATERSHLTEALMAAAGNVTRAARSLGLTRNAFRYRLRKLREAAEGARAAAVEPPPAATTASRWERRRVAFLRVEVAAAGEDVEHKQRILLHVVMQKIEVFGGAVDGVSPGGVTAVFGLDFVEDASRRAAHAGLAVRKLGARARELDATTPAMTLAIHEAPVLLWRLGDDVHLDGGARPALWRTLDDLVTAAEPGTILVSGATAASLHPTLHLVPAGSARDGTSILLEGERPPALHTPNARFIGRRDEMVLLAGRLELTLEGRGQVVALDGEPGIGKSRVLHEFRRLLDSRAAYLGARCVSYGRELPLLPVVELVRRALGIDGTDAPAAVAGAIGARLTALGLPAGEMTPYLLRLLGTPEAAESLAHTPPEAVYQRTLGIVRALVLALSSTRPLVIALEDLHWMDRASTAYVGALVEALVEAPVLLLTTHRTGYRAPWIERSYVTEVRLQPLGRADSRRVLDGTLGEARVAAEVAEAILDRADGNPFFIEELARALGSATSAETVPPSVEAVLLARIDRLAAEARNVLQAASVLGRDVPVPLLEAIVPEPAATTQHLRELRRLEYLHDRSEGAGTLYRFKHALTQEVTYSSLLPEHRRGLHARIVSAMETRYADRLGEQTERLAHHALHAERWDKALEYFRQTALRAKARSANYEAVAAFEHALAALDRLPERRGGLEAIDLRLEMFEPVMATAAYERCADRLAQAATLAEALGERARLGRALAARSLILRIQGAIDEAITVGRRALAVASEVGDLDLAWQTNHFLGTTYATRGEFREAVACYRQSFVPLERELTPERVRALPYFAPRSWLAWALESLGEFDEALELGREAVRIADLRGDKVPSATTRCLLANVHLGLGEAAEAIPLLEKAAAICRAGNVYDWLGPVLMRLGFAYALTGRLAEGIALGEEGRAQCEASRGITGHPTRLGGLAQSYLLAGRTAEAEATARQGIALAQQHRQAAGEAVCLHALGRVAVAAEPPDEATARHCFHRALQMAGVRGMRPLVAHCHLGLGTLDARLGRRGEAAEHVEAAATLYREMGMRSWLEVAHAEAKALGLMPA